MQSHQDYPISAIVGHGEVCQALMLAAIDPKIGGILIQGPKGTAKTTMARGIAQLLPQGNFINLPLSASEDRITGSIDLEQVLENGQVSFSPGLLHQAHEGVLYIDEVNLLADHLIDVLLDVAASGKNYVERDGVSHQHDARIILIGTMNPDEGELRSQILDRFGFCIQLHDQFEQQQRIEIVSRRLQFEEDPDEFHLQYEAAQDALIDQCRLAKKNLPKVKFDQQHLQYIAQICQQAQVEGLRADLIILRGARARAALLNKNQVDKSDIDFVAQFALLHRRKEANLPPPPSGETKPPNPSSNQIDHQQNEGQKDWGEMPRQSMETAAMGKLHWHAEQKALATMGKGRVSGTQTGQAKQAYHTDSLLIDWVNSLRHAKKTAQGFRLQGLRYRQSVSKARNLFVILLDASGSTLKHRVLAKAKGLIAGITKECYQLRQDLALFSFNGKQHQRHFGPARAPKDSSIILSSINAGGGTALRLAMEKTLQFLRKQNQTHKLMVITDGRCRDSLAELNLPCPTLFVDLEDHRLPLGRCQQYANQLGADYIHINKIETHDKK